MNVPRVNARWLALGAVVALLVFPGVSVGRSAGQQASSSEYVVLYADGVSLTSAHSAIRAAGGTLVKENTAVGVATVRSSNPRFVHDAAGQAALAGAARNVRDRSLRLPRRARTARTGRS